MVQIVDVSQRLRPDSVTEVARKSALMRQNQLEQASQPLRIKEARAQSQDADIKRAGQASRIFLASLGDVEGRTPDELAQQWQGAKQATAQFGFDLGGVPDDFSTQWLQAAQGFERQASGGASAPKVGAQKILDDGTIVQSTDAGPVVFNSLGDKVTGQAAADAIKAANEVGVDLTSRGAGGRTAASLAAQKGIKAEIASEVKGAEAATKLSTESFEKLGGVRGSIRTIDAAIDAIDEGAETGVVTQFLPSISQASIKLDQLQSQMGLDVISNTTFGALSEGELSLALNTALPKNLGPEDLREWLVEKKESQEKLSNYLEDAAAFLGRPGNTVAKFIDQQRVQRQQGRQQQAQAPQTAAPASQLSDEELLRLVGGQ